jgi:biopolymer transport protein ExbB
MHSYMRQSCKFQQCLTALITLVTVELAPLQAAEEIPWWDKQFLTRRKVTVDTTSAGADAAEAPKGAPVLVRLHDGAFNFAAAAGNGEDIRFISEDGKTVLSYAVERYDPLLLNQGYVWVKAPELKGNAKNTFWLYYGNATAPAVADAKGSAEKSDVLIWHFADGTAVDSSTNELNGQGAATPVEGSLMAGGIKMDGTATITAPAAPVWAWAQGATASVTMWVKADAPQTSTLFTRGPLTLGFDNGVLYLQIGDQKASDRAAMATAAWKHVGFTSGGGKSTLYLDGEPVATLGAVLPAVDAPASLGKVAGDSASGFTGELDELRISSEMLTPSTVRFMATMESPERGAAVVNLGPEETGGGGWLSGNSTSAVLVRSLTADGWVVIGLCAIMSVISWWIMISKIRLLNRLSAANALFMKAWKGVSRDLTVLDSGDAEVIKSLGGKIEPGGLKKLRSSAVYRVYHIGSEEITHRLAAEGGREKGLSARSMEAIKATMDGGAIREGQRLNSLVVLLTICISGGPFLGLLGTVVGVMITFAAIAAAGDVNVNSIAPGIAGALLATVAGLAVAIPARIKESTADMAVFIDEFITRVAEYYPPTGPDAH